MPIVINEIEIAVEVVPNNVGHNNSATPSATAREEIIKECVEKVMEILNQKNER